MLIPKTRNLGPTKSAGGRANPGESHNAGIEKSSAGKGQTIERVFGRDDSDYIGSKRAERGDTLGGSTTNIGHSITSGSANNQVK